MKQMKTLMAAVAAVVLVSCTAREINVTKAVGMDFKINYVSGTKVSFNVIPGNEDAWYGCLVVASDLPDYNVPEKKAAQNYIDFLEDEYDQLDNPTGSFMNMSCYRGKREIRFTHLSSNTDFKLLVFQVNPKTNEVLGDICSEIIHTKAVEMKDLEFKLEIEGNSLTLTPDDPERTYIWSIDRENRITDNYLMPYFYLYDLIDMYEKYGFVKTLMTKGQSRYELDPEVLWQDMNYCVAAIAYDGTEITSDIWSAYFIYLSDEWEILER